MLDSVFEMENSDIIHQIVNRPSFLFIHPRHWNIWNAWSKCRRDRPTNTLWNI